MYRLEWLKNDSSLFSVEQEIGISVFFTEDRSEGFECKVATTHLTIGNPTTIGLTPAITVT